MSQPPDVFSGSWPLGDGGELGLPVALHGGPHLGLGIGSSTRAMGLGGGFGHGRVLLWVRVWVWVMTQTTARGQ